jgi:hypothetical protein
MIFDEIQCLKCKSVGLNKYRFCKRCDQQHEVIIDG